jgi:hypothetical protein
MAGFSMVPKSPMAVAGDCICTAVLVKSHSHLCGSTLSAGLFRCVLSIRFSGLRREVTNKQSLCEYLGTFMQRKVGCRRM